MSGEGMLYLCRRGKRQGEGVIELSTSNNPTRSSLFLQTDCFPVKDTSNLKRTHHQIAVAPVTALIHKSTAGDKVIKLFYCTGKAQLGLALWSGTEDADPEEPIQPPTEIGEGQYITNPSQMSSIILDGEEKNICLDY